MIVAPQEQHVYRPRASKGQVGHSLMNHELLLVMDRGGNAVVPLVVALLAADLASLLLMPFFHFTQSERMKLFGGKAYSFLAVLTLIVGIILIPGVLLVIGIALVVRFRGTGIPQSAIAFVLGCAAWLASPLIFLALGQFQIWFAKRLAPVLWDKKIRTALRRRRKANVQ